jgi:hypothetical protein
MTNTNEMLKWLDDQIELASDATEPMLRDMRILIVTEAQRREAERLEIEQRGKAKAA